MYQMKSQILKKMENVYGDKNEEYNKEKIQTIDYPTNNPEVQEFINGNIRDYGFLDKFNQFLDDKKRNGNLNINVAENLNNNQNNQFWFSQIGQLFDQKKEELHIYTSNLSNISSQKC